MFGPMVFREVTSSGSGTRDSVEQPLSGSLRIEVAPMAKKGPPLHPTLGHTAKIGSEISEPVYGRRDVAHIQRLLFSRGSGNSRFPFIARCRLCDLGGAYVWRDRVAYPNSIDYRKAAAVNDLSSTARIARLHRPPTDGRRHGRSRDWRIYPKRPCDP